MSRILTQFTPGDDIKQYERIAQAMNLKSESYLGIYIETENGQLLAHLPVSADSTLYVIGLNADAAVAGSADGVIGSTIRFSGGSANKDVNVLPLAAITTTLTQSSFATATAPGYEVPAGGTLAIKLQSDDHVVTKPSQINLQVALRVV